MIIEEEGALKQAAIDAWMRDYFPYPAELRTVGESEYILVNVETEYHVTRPDSTGAGGGIVFIDHTFGSEHLDGGDICSYFEAICEEIDQILAPLRFTANSADFVEAEIILGPALNALITRRAGGQIGQGLTDPIRNAQSFIDDFQSVFLDAFSFTYLSRLDEVIASYYAIAAELGAALGGQENLWKQTPDAVDSAVHAATVAFHAHGQNAPFTWLEVLDVAKVMLEGVTAFIAAAALTIDPPTMPAGIAALLAGVTFVSDAGETMAATPPGPSYDSIMQAFKDSITGIIEGTRQQEEIMNDNLLDWCRSSRNSNLNLSNQLADEPIDSSGYRSDIQLDLQRCKALYEEHGYGQDGFLVQIKNGLTEARKVIELLVDNTLWFRDDRLGIGSRGYWHRWDELRWILRDLLVDLEWQTDKAVSVFRAVVAALDDTDANSATQLTQLRGQLDAGSGYSPTAWPPDWPTGPYHEHNYDGIGGY